MSGVLQLAMTLVLPLLALPGVLIGGPVPTGQLRVAWAGAGLFAVLVAAAALADDHLLRWVGRLAETIRRVANRSSEIDGRFRGSTHQAS